ncbi:DUF547 domain-containing protein [Fulvivirgaceae bacterium BMA12]|uniref:DUF547 domain-containing protein n=1 Tax=Agaribacillus aureus TaxID=3051825 RepID=A0ABT8LKB4_9BACT|nr:DUF547 domain-containing protein [Fulvivirgaceae bacterium BMA12]
MSKLIYTALLMFTLHPIFAQQPEMFFAEVDVFLKAYIHDGLFDYEKLHNQPEALEKLSTEIGNFDLRKLSGDERKAFYINAYNLLAILEVIRNYPVASPQHVPGFFNGKKNKIAGELLTLDDLENNKLRGKKTDPRIHFALICVAMGCPKIGKFAYRPSNLDQQLSQQTSLTLNDSTFIRVDKKKKRVLISEIFKWYKKDFILDEENVLSYINRYRNERIDPNFKVGYYPYDWSLNIKKNVSQATDLVENSANIIVFTPSVLLNKGQVEIKSFNNIYTQTAIDSDGEKVNLDERQTFYTGIFQLTYGISNSSRFNVGFDIYLNSVKYKPINGGNNAPFDRTAIGSLGPRIKVNPIARIPTFSVQSTLLFPAANNLESPRFLAHDRLTWWNQFFFDKTIDQFQIFAEGDLIFRFRKDATFVRTPVSLFLSYFPSQKATFYGFIQHSPRFDGNEGGVTRTAWFSQAGIGLKYQFTPRLNIELLATDFFTAKNDGLGKTYNIGFRFIN